MGFAVPADMVLVEEDDGRQFARGRFLAEAIGLPRALLLVVVGGVALAAGAGALRQRQT